MTRAELLVEYRVQAKAWVPVEKVLAHVQACACAGYDEFRLALKQCPMLWATAKALGITSENEFYVLLRGWE